MKKKKNMFSNIFAFVSGEQSRYAQTRMETGKYYDFDFVHGSQLKTIFFYAKN